MKKTIITLSSIVALASAANAQTYFGAGVANLSFDGTDTWTGTLRLDADNSIIGTATIVGAATANFADGFFPTNGERLIQNSLTDITTPSSGDWSLSFTADPGWAVDGVSVFSVLTNLGNPIFSNIVSSGTVTALEGNDDFFTVASGTTVASGGTLTSNQGTLNTGWVPGPDFSINAAASDLAFTYSTTPVTNISNEFLNFSVGVTQVPEPSSIMLSALAGLGLLARRKRA